MKKISSIPVSVISTFGHCGLDWLHSLIDSHKEVLIIPPFEFFRIIDLLERKKIYLNNSLTSIKITNIITKELLGKKFHTKDNILKKNQKKTTFKKYINDYLTKEKELDIKKRLFFAIHFAFAKINKINLKKIKIIVANESKSWHCQHYYKHFNSKSVLILRDPRAQIAGSLRMFKRSKNIPINFQFDLNLSCIIHAKKFLQKMKNKKILILKNEDMHKNLKPEMKRLCKWFNIRFSRSLLDSTFLGHKWIGESGYISKKDLKKPYPRNYYKPINVEKRWREILDKNSILMIETLSEKIMLQHKYKFDNKLNIISRFFGYLNLFFKFQEFKNFLYFIKLRLFKNIIRRIFVVFFPNQSRKIFDIA